MKKLIALTLSLALILSFSFAVMAAPVALVNLGTAGTDNNGTQSMSTTFDVDTMTFVTTVTGVTDQATLLVFKGNILTTDGDTNIQFIDQITVGTTTEFTYKLKVNPIANDQFTIKVGGSNLTTPLSQYVKPIAQAAPTTFTVSGTVTNVAATLNSADYEEGFETPEEAVSFVDKCNSSWLTKVKLIPEIQLHRIIKNIFDPATYPTDTSVSVVPQVTADPSNGSFALTNVPNGTYWLVIEREAYLTLFSKIVVDGSSILDINKTLLGGDYYSSRNLGIDAIDVSKLVPNTNSFESPLFNEKYDITSDGNANAIDLSKIFENSGKNYSLDDPEFYDLDLDELIEFVE